MAKKFLTYTGHTLAIVTSMANDIMMQGLFRTSWQNQFQRLKPHLQIFEIAYQSFFLQIAPKEQTP